VTQPSEDRALRRAAISRAVRRAARERELEQAAMRRALKRASGRGTVATGLSAVEGPVR
jgi:histone H3/H4